MKDTTNFSTAPYVLKVDKPWGSEIILTGSNSKKITSKMLNISAGKRISLQYHDLKEEVLTLFSGEAYLYIEDNTGKTQKINMEKHKGYLVLPFQLHRLEAVTDCLVFESSTKESGNTFRVEDDFSRGTETDEDRKKDRSNI